jgi:hypothetical protein
MALETRVATFLLLLSLFANGQALRLENMVVAFEDCGEFVWSNG